MSVASLCDAATAFDLCRELPQWIGRHRPEDGYRRFQAQELDYSFNGLPTLTVGISGAHGRIATYKSNIVLIPGEHDPWLIFSPLVVIWEKGKEERGPGLGRAIIDHSVSSIAGYCEAHLRHIPNILLASGKLTMAKAGRPFFETLGWEITSPRDCALPAGDSGLARVLAFIAAQIGAAIALLPPSEPEAASPISFAMLRLPQPGTPQGCDLPAQVHAFSGSPAAIF
jgi:hypothetical protein